MAMREWPGRWLTKATCLLSGDQCGWTLLPCDQVRGLASEAPVTGAIQRVLRAGQTTQAPSGDISMSSQSSLPHPISPSSLGAPPSHGPNFLLRLADAAVGIGGVA